MCAVIIPFPARDAKAASANGAARRPVKRTLATAHPEGLINADRRALKALIPKLPGKWLCEVGVDRTFGFYALIARDDWSRTEFFTVMRHGAALILFASCCPVASELLGIYDRMPDLAEALYDAACLHGA